MTEDIATLINRRRIQILSHSYIYYRLNSNVISDHTFDEWSMELVELQKKYPDIAKDCVFAEAFKDFDGSSGYDIPLGDEKVRTMGERVLKAVKYDNRKE